MTDTDKRIEALIERAGCPMMVVKNAEPKSFEDVRRSILRIADEQYDGSLIEYIRDIANTIDRLEGTLENALNERDAVVKHLKSHRICGACEYCEIGLDDPCLHCDYDNNCFEWRGVPDKEDA